MFLCFRFFLLSLLVFFRIFYNRSIRICICDLLLSFLNGLEVLVFVYSQLCILFRSEIYFTFLTRINIILWIILLLIWLLKSIIIVTLRHLILIINKPLLFILTRLQLLILSLIIFYKIFVCEIIKIFLWQIV